MSLRGPKATDLWPGEWQLLSDWAGMWCAAWCGWGGHAATRPMDSPSSSLSRGVPVVGTDKGNNGKQTEGRHFKFCQQWASWETTFNHAYIFLMAWDVRFQDHRREWQVDWQILCWCYCTLTSLSGFLVPGVCCSGSVCKVSQSQSRLSRLQRDC